MIPTPDVTLIYGEDVLEWDSYLTRQFEISGATIQHEQVEKMTFPLGCTKALVFSEARVVLVILSPALVRFLDRHAAEGFQFARLLKPSRTIAMICGASQTSILSVKNVLVSYDQWRHLEAKDKDINMVRDVIEMMQETLSKSKESERLNKPKFKLIPRKVQEGNSKVYVMLSKPLDNTSKIRITLETNGSRDVAVKKRNPYTLAFVIPDELIHVQNMVNVHIWCGEDLLGVSPVKCVSKLGELYSLLISSTSPYEFLCNTLGFASLHEVDKQLASLFRKNLPKTGLGVFQCEGKQDSYTTKEEFPTLLHFAAHYGLCQLVKELLNCPGAQAAAIMKNVRGLTPAQLANHEGYVKAAVLLDEYLQKSCSVFSKEDLEAVVPCNQTIAECRKSNPVDYYDIPSHPVPVLCLSEKKSVNSLSTDKDCDYMKMKGSHKENIEPFPNGTFHINEKDLSEITTLSTNNAERAKLTLLESQAKLIEIMEAYKKGASFTEVEKLHNEWKTQYRVSDAEAKSTLDGLRNLYAKAQKAKLNKKHSSSFSELRHFLNSKLRRKESMDSKGTLNRRSSKDSNSCKALVDSDPIRPVSTLSVLSNTSSSSGSSFDRLSMASAGSDSGHHSDFAEDRHHKFRESYESRYQQQRKVLKSMGKQSSLESANFQSKLQSLTLNSKPPAPPPRPVKPSSHYGSLEDCKTAEVPQYSVLKKKSTFEEDLKQLDYSIPKSSTLGSDFKFDRLDKFLDGDVPTSDYDCVPPPISCALFPHNSSTFLSEPAMDYDIVPPPLPLTSPPDQEDPVFAYDILPSIPRSARVRSSSVSLSYDFPKIFSLDNTDTQISCNCNISASKSNLGSIKSCCLGNKLSSLKKIDVLPSVPNIDVAMDKASSKSKDSKQNQYCNVIMSPLRESDKDKDDIPAEMAPPPPYEENASPEEHYKLVPAPLPISAGFKIS